ncbi:hypothetical protein E2C01_025020 [Portunus trituberculatus]|uniref:Uncharacterized protein n=1 Tax=Portunus trituberculatus TaxID=210409 RepID=A0A5B7EFG2_PORTR|nr:hypothetical protein [Portunus trituberculatus]
MGANGLPGPHALAAQVCQTLLPKLAPYPSPMTGPYCCPDKLVEDFEQKCTEYTSGCLNVGEEASLWWALWCLAVVWGCVLFLQKPCTVRHSQNCRRSEGNIALGTMILPIYVQHARLLQVLDQRAEAAPHPARHPDPLARHTRGPSLPCRRCTLVPLTGLECTQHSFITTLSATPPSASPMYTQQSHLLQWCHSHTASRRRSSGRGGGVVGGRASLSPGAVVPAGVCFACTASGLRRRLPGRE